MLRKVLRSAKNIKCGGERESSGGGGVGQERGQNERRSDDADWEGGTQAGGNTFK